MTHGCPRCSAPIELTQDGAHRCSRCRLDFDYYQGAAAMAPAGPRLAPAPQPNAVSGLVSGAICATHPGNAAATLCERCGGFMCGLCTIRVEGRSYCADCFNLLTQRGAFRFAQRSFSVPNSALTLAIFSVPALLSWPIAIVLAVLALFTASRGLREIEKRSDLPGRGQCIAAVVVAGLALVGALVIGAVMIVAVVRSV